MPGTDQNDGDISRDNFDGHWLRSLESAHHYENLEHLPVQEIEDSRQLVEHAVRQAIVDHHIHRQRIAERLRTLGHEVAATFFADELPKNQQTRKGNFGEVVASEHLVQRFGCAMPVLKLRYRDSANLPMRGEDIVAFQIEDGRITCVCVGEAKAVVTYRRQTVLEAHKRLDHAYHPRPLTLAMIAQILYDRGDKKRATLKMSADGSPALALMNSEGEPGTILLVQPNGRGNLAFYDKAGQIIWIEP